LTATIAKKNYNKIAITLTNLKKSPYLFMIKGNHNQTKNFHLSQRVKLQIRTKEQKRKEYKNKEGKNLKYEQKRLSH
jgi:predicted MPP superfamily phosphohydrolase